MADLFLEDASNKKANDIGMEGQFGPRHYVECLEGQFDTGSREW